MTDEKTQALPPAAPEPGKKTTPPVQKTAPARLGGGARLLLALSLILSLGAAGGAGYLVYWYQLKHMQDTEQLAKLNSAVSDSSARLDQLQTDLQQATGQLQQNRQALQKSVQARSDLTNRMAALEQQIAVVTGSHRIDWMLKEVEQFVMMAERRLSLLADTNGALALLQEADNITRDMDEPATRPLREALAKNIHDLKIASESNVDVDGIFVRIEDLAKRAPNLNLPRFELYQKPPVNTASSPLPDSGLALFWYRLKDFMGSLVRYKYHEKHRPLVLTADRDYLVQGIVLMLQQAQLALLRGDSDAYRLSLKQASDSVQSYMPVQSDESKFFITELDALASIQLRPPVPTINESVRAVQVFRDYWTQEKLQRQRDLYKLEAQQQAKAGLKAKSATAPSQKTPEAKPKAATSVQPEAMP